MRNEPWSDGEGSCEGGASAWDNCPCSQEKEKPPEAPSLKLQPCQRQSTGPVPEPWVLSKRKLSK